MNARPFSAIRASAWRIFGPGWPRTSCILLLMGLFLGGLSGCGRHGKAAPVGGSAVPPSQTKLQRAVEVGQVEKRSLEIFVETVGYLEAEGQTELSAGVNGVVDEVLFREGDIVTPGTPLLKIDQRRYEALLAQADANLMKSEANVIRGEASVKKSEAALDFAQRTKALDEARYEFAIKSKGGIAREELAEREAAVKQAGARVDEARAGVDVAKAELSAARKEVDAMKAMRDLAQRNRNLSIVRAPYAGQINQRRITTPGTYVEDKTVIATMADISKLRLVGWIPEKAAPIVREMMQSERGARSDTPPSRFALEFRLLPYPDRVFKGRIFYLSTVANPETHMFECKAEVDSSSDVELRPGYMARIRAPIRGNPNALAVPEEAVRASERGFVAFVPEARTTKDGKEEWVARARTVEVGYRSGIGRQEDPRTVRPGGLRPGMVEVLQGVREGEWVVTRGAEALEDGTPIAIPAEQIGRLKK